MAVLCQLEWEQLKTKNKVPAVITCNLPWTERLHSKSWTWRKVLLWPQSFETTPTKVKEHKRTYSPKSNSNLKTDPPKIQEIPEMETIIFKFHLSVFDAFQPWKLLLPHGLASRLCVKVVTGCQGNAVKVDFSHALKMVVNTAQDFQTGWHIHFHHRFIY